MTTPTTIYEAIKTDDYRGLLTLYATTVYDAVHSAEFAASLCGEIDVGMGGDGVFVDEKKFERHHSLGSSSSKPTSIQQLDDAVRSILNPDLFSCRQQRFNSTMVDDAQDLKQDDIKRRSFKKIRQSPSNLLKKDNSDKVSSQREAYLSRIMWESAAMLSNSHPPTNFVVERKERVRRDGLNRMKSEETSPANTSTSTSTNSGTNSTNNATGNSSSESSPPLFEGSISNATPGTTDDGGTGSGTAQHLACLLDSPLALIILIVMGIDVDSRHTAFRRLAMHEAACADSPGCLELLMCMAGRYRDEKDSVMWRDGRGEENEVRMMESPRSGGKMKLPFFSWGENGVKGRFKKEDDMVCDADAESTTTFPEALKIIWEIIHQVESKHLTESEAAHQILEQVSIPSKSKTSLALQLGPDSSDDNRKSALYLYGLSRYQQPNRIPTNIDGHGNTPLHWASFKNSTRAIDILLSHNVNVNYPAQPSGWTPLHDAAYSDSAGAVSRLIAAGAQVNARSHSGATPLCFAAQEDAAEAMKLLLRAGADPAIRCLGASPTRANNADANVFHSRFSGYTPLHYCAHYNSSKSAKVLLNHATTMHLRGAELLEIPDLNEKLPIHVAVARGSSEVLRELLHGGARVETASYHPPLSPRVRKAVAQSLTSPTSGPITIPTRFVARSIEHSPTNVVTPVSSPVLRSLLPSQPISSSKPWNCLSQKSIDACRSLIEEVEQNWTPARHALFSPTDRVAVKEVLRVGKRLEQEGCVILEIWPFVLSFCGRGWFEVDEMSVEKEEEMQEEEDSGGEFTQFELDEA